MRKLSISFSLILLASFVATQNTDVLTMRNTVGTKFTCSISPTTPVSVIKAIGDVNGDLISDIAVGVPGSNIVAIIYGGANLLNGLDVCTFTDLSVGYRIKGAYLTTGTPAVTKFGASIANVGDLNGDGLQDIAVAAISYGTAASSSLGRVYVIYTPALNGRRLEYSINSLSTYTFTSSTASAALGTFLADAIDYNGDGLKDLLVGSATADANAYIFFGQASGSGDTTTATLTTSTGVAFPQPSDGGFGQSPLASCGDLNQDGISDFVLLGTNNLFVLFGAGVKPTTTSVPVTTTNAFTIPYGSPLTFGYSITCADLDMDGRQEVILSSTTVDKNVHVLYGSALGALVSSSIYAKSTSQGFVIAKTNPSSTFGKVLKRTDGWNGYGQDVLLIADPASSQVTALLASTALFGVSKTLNNLNIDTIESQYAVKINIYTQDSTFLLGSAIDATYDVNGDGLKDLLVAEGVSSNFYAYYGTCNSASGCVCPSNMKYQNGYCVNYGLSGGQKTGIIVGVIIGAMLLIALGVLILKKTSCGANCFESYAKPAQFGSHSHAPIPQTMATSA